MNSKDISQLNLRLPIDLKHWLKTSALENRRTITAEAIHILESYRKAKEQQNIFSKM